MSQLAILRRHLSILRLVSPPFSYPSKREILDCLREDDLDFVSNRTFERDKKEIEDYYGIRIERCPKRRGYYLNQPEDEDLSNFQQFFQLLERSERLTFLTHSSDALRTSKYLLLENNLAMLGLEHLPVLWEALRKQRQLSFSYQTFQTHLPKSYQLDPLMLLEYRNRWYLAAWDTSDKRFKTFGLERMLAPQVTEVLVKEDRSSEFLALKQDALGVFIGPDHEVAQVVLRVNAAMAPYIKTVPIHPSQSIVREHEEGMIISLHIILNPELESAILSFGDHVEVLEPAELREKIKDRAEKLLERYRIKKI